MNAFWKPPTETPENRRKVWVLSQHPKQVFPDSVEIRAGQVCYAPNYPEAWRVENGDAAGNGWTWWEPNEFDAWCYAEEFNPLPDWLSPTS